MRPKSLALLALALGCGLVASIGITQVMAKRTGDAASPAVETATIFVALKDVPLGDTLTPELLRAEPWPKDKVPTGAIQSAEQIDGRRTRAKLYAGEPILENKLFAKGATNNTSGLVPKGYRVASVKVDMVSGSGLILPGDRVDVFVYLVKNPQRNINETTARMILQDVKVFAVNDIVNLESDKDNKDAKSIQAKTISLLVTPEQAAKVALASELGSIRLVMRGPDDDKELTEVEARPHELFGGTQTSNRDQESLVEPISAEPVSSPATPATTAASSAEPPAPEQWKVRILQPGGVNEVVFERPAGKPNAAEQPWQNAPSLDGTAKPAHPPKVPTENVKPETP